MHTRPMMNLAAMIVTILSLSGCGVCSYDTFSTPKPIGDALVPWKSPGEKPKHISLQFGDFSLMVSMLNHTLVPFDEGALWIGGVIPVQPSSKGVEADSYPVVIHLGVFPEGNPLNLSSHNLLIDESQFQLTVNNKAPISPVRVTAKGYDLGKEEVNRRESKIAISSATSIHLEFEIEWNPESEYVLSGAYMTYMNKSIPFPDVRFSKCVISKCETAP